MNKPRKSENRTASNRARLGALLAGFVLLGVTPPLSAQLTPIGPEVSVSTDPHPVHQFPRVARNAEPGFVVSWFHRRDDWPWDDGIMVGRTIEPDGEPVGAEFRISEDEVQSYAGLLESSPGGEFVLAWGQGFSGPGGGDPDDIHARRFTADGSPLGAEFQVNTTPGNEYTGLTGLTMRAAGDFVVAWYNDYYGSFLRHYDSDGTPLSDEILLSLPGGVGEPRIVADSNDDLFAVWNRSTDVYGARFQVDGTPLGPSFPIASFLDGNQYAWDLTRLEDGSVVVTWISSSSPGDDDSGYSIQARRFDAAGTPLGDQFQVNTFVQGNQLSPRLDADSSGGFVVVWSSEDSGGADNSESSVQIRRFAADGSPFGREIQVNQVTAGGQERPAVATDPSGIVMVTWTGEDESIPRAYLVQSRIYRLSLFSDDFETGDATRWSLTLP